MSDIESDSTIRSQRASALLSNQLPTPKARKSSYQQPTLSFEVENDGANGDKLADRYQVLEQLGSGSFGVVYKAIEKETGEIVAIKHVDLESSEEDLSDIISELSVLSSCASNHVTRYRSAFLRRQTLWIVMEYLGGGSAADLLKPPPHSLSESHIAIMCRELLVGLAYLHSEGKIHRDIKAANVLLGMDGRVKLADFGVATQLTGLKSIRNTFVGTPFWMAPEVIQQEGHDAKADVWSLGITAMELANGEPPHANVHPMKVLFLIPKQAAPRLTDGIWSKDFRDFVAACLTKDVEKRPSAKELLRHRFVKNAGKIEGLQELIQRKQEYDSSRGGERNLKYYAETLRALKAGVTAEYDAEESDDWVFETVKAVPTIDRQGMQTQKRRKVASVDARDEATHMMEDLMLDDVDSIRGTVRKVSFPISDSPTIVRQISATQKRVPSNQQRQPLGINMSFGNSPSTVRQFRRVSPASTTPDLENDNPLQIPKKSPLKVQIHPDKSNISDTALSPVVDIPPKARRPPLSRYSSNASTLAAETKEASLGRRLYTSAIGISCQEVLNETGHEEKREAVSRLAEAFSDLEATDPDGLYHIMTAVIGRMKTDTKLHHLLPQPPSPPPLGPVAATPTKSHSQPQSETSAPVTPSRTPAGPKLVMAQNNPHLKSHRRRQSAQVQLHSRDSSAAWSSPRGGGDDSAITDKKLSKIIAGHGQLEHTRAMTDIMFERWCDGLRNRWPAV